MTIDVLFLNSRNKVDDDFLAVRCLSASLRASLIAALQHAAELGRRPGRRWAWDVC